MFCKFDQFPESISSRLYRSVDLGSGVGNALVNVALQ
jgi:hypothetical protein